MSELEPRTEILKGSVNEVADNVEKTVREFLKKHEELGIITQKQVDKIAINERASAIGEYLTGRLEGRENDDSGGPGITIFVTEKGKEDVVKNCSDYGYPILPEQIRQISQNLWVLSFKRGIYYMGFGGAQFFQEGEGPSQKGTVKPFTLYYSDVVRVETPDGHLWQNWDYNWDGTPKRIN